MILGGGDWLTANDHVNFGVEGRKCSAERGVHIQEDVRIINIYLAVEAEENPANRMRCDYLIG